MKAYKKNPGSESILGWEWTSLEHGYRIRIDINKEVEIRKTAKRSDFKFD